MPDVFRVIVAGLINGVDATRNVFTFSSGGTIPSLTAVETWLDNFYTANYLSTVPNIWATYKYIIEVPDGAGHWSYYTEHAYVKAGTSAGQALPQQCAAVIIGVTQSRRRGKKFLGPVNEANSNNGVLDPGLITVLSTVAQGYITDLQDGAVAYASGVCKPDGSDFLPFVSARVDTIMGTQRRRKQGKGA